MRVSFDGKRQATAEVYFSRSDGVQSSVSGSDRRKWDDDMKKALGIGGFPLELALNRIGKKEVPISFNENPVTRLNEEIKIFVTQNQYLNAKFRVIFTRTKIQHPSGAESKRWLVGPNMTSLNSSTSLYGAQRQAVEYLVKFSIRFQNRSSRF